MDDLITWLRAQLDDDEKDARDAAGRSDHWDLYTVPAVGWGIDEKPMDVLGGGKPLLRLNPEYASSAVGEHITRHDPARVLREVEAQREIIKLAERVYSTLTYDTVGSPASYAVAAAADTLRLLALPFSDRPGYLDTWRP